MASENSINRVYRNLAAGMPVEEIYKNLITSGESQYDAWLAYCAAQVAVDQNEAFAKGLSIQEWRKISLLEEEESNKHNLRDER